ncbi:alpha/beta hydrolase [Hoeflea sp. WL0058]|uniref:Alpha/beta hydrolase n=1 Tax=Flavimaribacter sediminis TaxID=2865987 RepID=A0AAE3D348_9HYPH|nr:alpha/beta hydrolase [Flavimaribacter sediminis]MBW8640509.1 alpha/beta hydrolase [Flavimaribacter sediminis]
MPEFKNDQISSAPVVVALHSSASSGAQWRTLAVDCAGQMEVIAPDLPGYGQASLTRDISQKGVAAAAAPVIELIERNGKPVHLVGHSNGAGVALKIAMVRPDLVKSLALYEPATFHFLNHGCSIDRALFRQISRLAGLVSVSLAFGNPDRGMRAFINFWNGDGAWESLPDKSRNKFASQARSIIADFNGGFAESWSLKDLGAINLPTLMMSGGRSPDIAERVTSHITSAFRDVRTEAFPALGHMAPVFNPDVINPVILRHIARVEGADAASSARMRSAA